MADTNRDTDGEGLSPEMQREEEHQRMFAWAVRAETNAVADMLIAKNKAYGNSALDPVRFFSQASPVEQIKVRLDDKLSRLARGHAAGEDVPKDMLGYLILLRIADRGLEAYMDPEVEACGECMACGLGDPCTAPVQCKSPRNSDAQLLFEPDKSRDVFGGHP